MFRNAVRLFDIAGFEIRVDPSWLLIATLIVWSLSTAWFPVEIPGIAPATSILLSIIAMLGLFAGLVLHELSHALTARRFGLGVGGITLFLFGGVAELEQEPESPKSEFWIALAGPAMSFALAALASGMAGLGAGLGWSAEVLAVLDYLAVVNLILAVFNLLPAFPLDGGRVLRAALWRFRGDLLEATRIASFSGAALGYALILLGVLALFAGTASMAGLWQILIGVFLVAAARGTYAQMRIRIALTGKTVAHLMSPTAITISPEDTVETLVDTVMLAHALSFVPVVEEGRLLGYIDTRVVHEIDRENWDTTRVDDVFVGLDPSVTVAPDTPVEALFDRIVQSGRRKFLVTSGDRLVGVISLSDLTGYLAVLGEIGAAGGSARSKQGAPRQLSL